ncbi:hypothetical protein ATE92_2503 [Ulvibacter sp. MAR_2010_11]|uniref:DUF6452 family protein n=1 Tax=Ulvibacter sp. MAR_2010_11 TaxID=1250229 RepID=UPI000C2CDF35|nr:DUF6452 family protein [Ulvibacter sp. MAR_2010_11]PKA84321.1 hypothetical protein ATE92_2503 [Ulvibacter sp. MAR_2010_11]
MDSEIISEKDMLKKIIILITIFTALNGCTRDDICSEGTATTPLLIITFKDSANPLVAKDVPNLTIETADNNSTQVITQTTTDSIAIPLNVSADISKYRFKYDDEGENPNMDILTFTYSREDIYVNRACAFKTVFDNLAAAKEDEGSANWVFSIIVEQQRIENETQAHITILH